MQVSSRRDLHEIHAVTARQDEKYERHLEQGRDPRVMGPVQALSPSAIRHRQDLETQSIPLQSGAPLSPSPPVQPPLRTLALEPLPSTITFSRQPLQRSPTKSSLPPRLGLKAQLTSPSAVRRTSIHPSSAFDRLLPLPPPSPAFSILRERVAPPSNLPLTI